SSTLICAVKSAPSSMPSRLKVLNPTRVNVTAYWPGRRPTILYSPVSSVTPVRTFSMRASLLASTLTPGKIAPDVSLTTPAIALCANVRVGDAPTHPNAMNTETASFRIISLPPSPTSYPPMRVTPDGKAAPTCEVVAIADLARKGTRITNSEKKRRTNEEKCELAVRDEYCRRP